MVCTGLVEVLVFEMVGEAPKGFDDYFTNGGRDVNDYDVTYGHLPLQMESRVKSSLDQTD
jgi:hypothetical protein